MIIEKKLKRRTFLWTSEDKKLTLFADEGIGGYVLSRVEMFSLVRFILRIAQKGKPRK